MFLFTRDQVHHKQLPLVVIVQHLRHVLVGPAEQK